jgi:cob(I)alamin adenosyltransferase
MSEDKPFDAPRRVAINRVYTKKGDGGLTALAGGQERPKHDVRIEAYGAVDELNAFVGSARQTVSEQSAPPAELPWLDRVLARTQQNLFNLGSLLATLPEDLHPRQARIRPQDIEQLERDIDRCNEVLPPLRSFVLPGGSRLNADLHVCRTVCRRAERRVSALGARESVDALGLVYLNRLSDAFFVFSRWVVAICRGQETLWDPNAANEEPQG